MEYSELAYLAKQKKISIASIAEAMGMTRQGFHAGIVNGSFTQEKIMRLCQILGISPNEFMGWNEYDVKSDLINGDADIKCESDSDLGCLMNILSRFLLNQEQYQAIMKDMMAIYKRINNR